MTTLTNEEKALIYSATLIGTIEALAKELGEPDINMAISALVRAQAHLVAKVKDRASRRLIEKYVAEALRDMVVTEVNNRILKELAAEGAA